MSDADRSVPREIPTRDNFVKRSLKFNETMVELSKHSDTELALVTLSILEKISIDILLSYTIELDRKEYKEIFEGTGPLVSFYSRILLIHSFGLISKEVRDEVRKLAEIRNKFAHEFDIASFDHDVVKQKCGELQLITEEKLSVAVLGCFPGHTKTERKFSKAGAMLTDKNGVVAVWIDPLLPDPEKAKPKIRFVNSVKGMFFVLGGIMWTQYCKVSPS